MKNILKKIKPKNKKLLIAGFSTLMFLFVILGALYGTFHFYYSKLNIQDAKDLVVEYVDEEEFIKEEQDENAINSTDEEIQKVNDNIKNNINTNNYDVISNKDVTNILLIGSDTRKKGQTARSDAMIILSINSDTKEIVATSLLRDIYVEIDGKGNNKLNAAYAFGGVDLLKETIENNLKIKIDRYVAVDFFSFVDIIDIIGGIELEITEKEMEYINGYLHEINKLEGYPKNDDQLSDFGLVSLDGRQALSYSRIRYIGTDFGRTERQRKVLEQVFYKIKECDFVTLNKLCLSIFPLITTDLTESEALGLLFDMKDYKDYELTSNHLPYDNTFSYCTINQMSVISIDFEKNIKMFNETVYNIPADLDKETVESADVIK